MPMARALSPRELIWVQRVGNVVDDFVGSRYPSLLLAWFACGLIVLATLFIVWMTFVPGLPIEPELSLENYFDVFDSYLCASGHRFHSER